MKKLFLVFIFLFTTFVVPCSSEIKLIFNPGLGFYSMYSISQMNKMTRESLPISVKQISDFPPYWNFYTGINIINPATSRGYGLYYSFESTGSRMSLADYSGEYYNNFTANAHSFGFSVIYSPMKQFVLPIFAEIIGGYKLTTLSNKEYWRIGTQDTVYTAEFNAGSFFIEPCLNIVYSYKFMEFGFKAGYQLDLGGEYKIVSINSDTKNSGTPIANPANPNRALNTEWSGLRLNLLFMLNLNKVFSHKIN